MDDEQRCDGSAFQTVGAATWKLRRPSCVLVEGTSMSWRSAERRFARQEMPATGGADVVEVGKTVITDTVKRKDCYFELYSLRHWEPMKHVAKGWRDANTNDQTGGSVRGHLKSMGDLRRDTVQNAVAVINSIGKECSSG